MIEIKNIYSGYGRKQVLSDVCANIKKGKITTVIGPNGSGKSTLVKAIAGILPCFFGEVLIEGIPIDKLKRKTISQKIAYLAQGKTTPNMTVSQMVIHGRFPYINYPRHYSKEDKELSFSAMKCMNIEKFADYPMNSLSGGMQQAAYIAMALCQNTDFILMDEPTTYLDIANSMKLINILSNLAQNGKGIIVVLHDLILALECSDNIIVMKDGKVVIEGSADAIYNSGVIYDVFGVNIKRYESETGFLYRYVI